MLISFALCIFLGFIIAMPVGPMGTLCIRESLLRGMSYGLAVGLGVTVADTIFAIITSFGITAIIDLILANHIWIGRAGGFLLCFLGIYIAFYSPHIDSKSINEKSYLSLFLTGLSVTLINPAAVLIFIGLYAGLAKNLEANNCFIEIFVLGIFIGSCLWWSLLSAAASAVASRLRGLFDLNLYKLLNLITGFILFAFGLLFLFHIS
jgi:threonine/homoserine/homoserine lactone efflux protein